MKRIVIVAYEINEECPEKYIHQRVQDAIRYGVEETVHSAGAPSIQRAEIVGQYTTLE